MPVQDRPRAVRKVFIDNNPQPDLDTVERYFAKHFMILLSEDSMPITSVIAYVKETGFENTKLMIDIINDCYGHFSSELNQYREAHKPK